MRARSTLVDRFLFSSALRRVSFFADAHTYIMKEWIMSEHASIAKNRMHT